MGILIRPKVDWEKRFKLIFIFILIYLGVLLLTIVPHEMGHQLVADLVGIEVDIEYSLSHHIDWYYLGPGALGTIKNIEDLTISKYSSIMLGGAIFVLMIAIFVFIFSKRWLGYVLISQIFFSMIWSDKLFVFWQIYLFWIPLIIWGYFGIKGLNGFLEEKEASR